MVSQCPQSGPTLAPGTQSGYDDVAVPFLWSQDTPWTNFLTTPEQPPKQYGEDCSCTDCTLYGCRTGCTAADTQASTVLLPGLEDETFTELPGISGEPFASLDSPVAQGSDTCPSADFLPPFLSLPPFDLDFPPLVPQQHLAEGAEEPSPDTEGAAAGAEFEGVPGVPLLLAPFPDNCLRGGPRPQERGTVEPVVAPTLRGQPDAATWHDADGASAAALCMSVGSYLVPCLGRHQIPGRHETGGTPHLAGRGRGECCQGDTEEASSAWAEQGGTTSLSLPAARSPLTARLASLLQNLEANPTHRPRKPVQTSAGSDNAGLCGVSADVSTGHQSAFSTGGSSSDSLQQTTEVQREQEEQPKRKKLHEGGRVPGVRGGEAKEVQGGEWNPGKGAREGEHRRCKASGRAGDVTVVTPGIVTPTAVMHGVVTPGAAAGGILVTHGVIGEFIPLFPGSGISQEAQRILTPTKFTSSQFQRRVVQQLLQLATAYATQQTDLAQTQLLRLRKVANPRGAVAQRLAHYMVAALVTRFEGCGTPTAALPPLPAGCPVAHAVRGMKRAWGNFPGLVFTQSFVEGLRGKDTIHIVLLTQCCVPDWAALFTRLTLALPPGATLRVLVSYIVTCPMVTGSPVLQASYRVMLGGELESAACRAGAHLRWTVLFPEPAEFSPRLIGMQEGESVAVGCFFVMQTLPDETVVRHNPRDLCLHWIKSLNPTVLTIIDHDTDHNSPFFLSRFGTVVKSTLEVLDNIEKTILLNSSPESRLADLSLEAFLAYDFMNCIAYEGLMRFERAERLFKWEDRLHGLGFKKRPMLPGRVDELRSEVWGSHKHLFVETVSGCVRLDWNGSPILFAGDWE